MAHKVAIIGTGKIGSLIACILGNCEDYDVTVIDRDFTHQDITRVLDTSARLHLEELDVSQPEQHAKLKQILQQRNISAILSSLPYSLNQHILPIARDCNCHYFDLTEDTATTKLAKQIAAGASTAFVPQCGLAPGFISVAAQDLMQKFERCESVQCRVGALPQNSNNALQYALTWSTEGLINIYSNPCPALMNGERVMLEPLDGYETLQLDGLDYEAFNTSGGLGGLVELCEGKVNELNYKTIRYPGHRDIMRVLMRDLKLKDKPDVLRMILEDALPTTYEDVVLVYVAVKGYQGERFLEKTYFNKFYPEKIHGLKWSAIQVTTASEICAVADVILQDPAQYPGLILQENLTLEAICHNRFGQCFQTSKSSM